MRSTSNALILFVATILAGTTLSSSAAESVGYKDTPMLPDQPWHVHDSDRPAPTPVTPGETFSHNAPAPSDAVVLFDGKDLSKWNGNKGPAPWKVENGYAETVADAGDITTKDQFGDFQLHLEFATPVEVKGSSQGRGNSGIKIYGLYEIQILDSYNNRTYADGQVGAIYGQFPPLVNPAKKPGEWQSYDIIFEGPRWNDKKELTKKANVTVILNGLLLHHHKELLGDTRNRALGSYARPIPPRGPIMLQDHKNPIRFRNIWIRELGEYDKPAASKQP